jgi:ATP-dependent Clp protease adaptor protein ClpS
MPGNSVQLGGDVLEQQHQKTQTPKMFRVVLINDDYTTMEFVVGVLESVFQKGPAEAHRLMMQVHTQGRAVCGTYTYEVAETKVGSVRDLASQEGFPLQANIEEA